jgi:hypothetical protein
MATKTLSLNKLVSSDFSEGSSWILNKGGGGDTDVGYFVFNGIGAGSVTISNVSFKINSIKTGGNSFFQEDVNLNFEFGTYSGSTFTKSSAFSFSGQKVKESEGNTSKTATASGSATLNGDALCIKLTMTPGSSGVGDKITMSGFTLAVTYEIPHTHSYTSTVTTQPTCTTTGVRTYTCSCGSSYTESIPALGHSYDSGVITKQPTCTEKGVKTYTCQNDSSHKYTEDIPAKGHTWVNATCTTPKTCSVCGATEGQPLGHDYKSTVIDPTSTANGYTEYVCSRCGDSYRNSYTCRVYGMGEPLNTGSVKIDGGSNLKIVNQGDEVTLLAGGANGYAFKQWNDGNTENPRTVKVTNSVTYTAIYEEIAKPPVYVNGNRCNGIYIDEENKKIIFRSDDATSQISDAIDTVDGWHFETIWAAPPAGVKAVKKIYIGTTQIY